MGFLGVLTLTAQSWGHWGYWAHYAGRLLGVVVLLSQLAQ